MTTFNPNQGTVDALNEVLTEVKRKLWLAQTGRQGPAAQRTIQKRARQIIALQESISHFS